MPWLTIPLKGKKFKIDNEEIVVELPYNKENIAMISGYGLPGLIGPEIELNINEYIQDVQNSAREAAFK